MTSLQYLAREHGVSMVGLRGQGLKDGRGYGPYGAGYTQDGLPLGPNGECLPAEYDLQPPMSSASFAWRRPRKVLPGSVMVGLSPTTQRVEGYPFGECVRASYATILDLPLASVPRFDPGSLRPGENQTEREREWLHMIGLDLIEISADEAAELPPEDLDRDHLVSGISPRGLGHRCVGHGGRVVWDPHPSRAGLVQVLSFGILVPRC